MAIHVIPIPIFPKENRESYAVAASQPTKTDGHAQQLATIGLRKLVRSFSADAISHYRIM